MNRIKLLVAKNLIHLPYWLFKLYQYGNHNDRYDDQTRYDFLRKFVIHVNKSGHMNVHCTGLENLPKETGYILFPNHQGLYDAFAFIETHDRPFGAVMKKEVKDMPFLKQVIKLLKCLIIDREDIRQSMKMIHDLADQVKEGRNFVLFAEGTRSKNGNYLGEFKPGSFKSAYYAKCPIVPVALLDSYKVFDTNSTKKVDVQIHYLKPLYYEDYKDLKTVEVAALVQNMITERIAQAEAERGNEYIVEKN